MAKFQIQVGVLSCLACMKTACIVLIMKTRLQAGFNHLTNLVIYHSREILSWIDFHQESCSHPDHFILFDPQIVTTPPEEAILSMLSRLMWPSEESKQSNSEENNTQKVSLRPSKYNANRMPCLYISAASLAWLALSGINRSSSLSLDGDSTQSMPESCSNISWLKRFLTTCLAYLVTHGNQLASALLGLV